MRNASASFLAATLALAAAGPASAIGIVDATGDYVAGYTGSRRGDLDVVGSFVTYNQADNSFVFSGTMDANIGLSAGGFYVWGVNRGNNTAGFAVNGLPNVLFDAVVIFRQDGSGTVNRINGAGQGAIQLPAGTAKIVGSTITGLVAGDLLPSNGLAKQAYTWNLWPRDGTLPAGFGQISDFAPDTNNTLVTVIGAVPEPASALLMGAGIAAFAWRRRQTQGSRQA